MPSFWALNQIGLLFGPEACLTKRGLCVSSCPLFSGTPAAMSLSSPSLPGARRICGCDFGGSVVY